ncbi:hypothetical protein PLESTB_000879200 [Pleodorina starrii]|uniref:Uncharacterized protein n=1 Tax=Pleodorina starrii TaxID=330485 RepID=A0A9W6F3L0_9CHLO|nr:hypothetical protein PLESTB_000879200 [Pleodorina starrii]
MTSVNVTDTVLRLDGASASSQLPYVFDATKLPASNGQEFTYSMWLYLADYDASDKHRMIIRRGGSADKLGTSSPLIFLNRSTNRVHVAMRTNQSSVVTSLDGVLAASSNYVISNIEYLPLQRWVHVAVSVQDSVLSVFMDGELYSVTNITDALDGNDGRSRAIFRATGGSIFIGDRSAPSRSFISNVQFFSYALSQRDVMKVYNRGPVRTSFLSAIGLSMYGLRSPVYKISDDVPDGSPSSANIVLQVVVGLILALGVYWLSLLVMRTDKLVIDRKLGSSSPKETEIINGYVDCASFVNKSYNTSNTASPTFLSLPRSVNRKGGAQFTYSLWLYMTNVSDDNVRNKILFSRGSMKPYRYVRTPSDGVLNTSNAADLFIRCPLVRFGSSYRELVVEFNTADDPDQRVSIINRQDTDDSAMRRNAASLMANYWVMLTLVFEDNVPINDFENGVVVKYYLNDMLYQVSRVRSTLRQNNGALNILPHRRGESGMRGARMASFSYYNYALSLEDIAARYLRGPSRTIYKDPADRMGMPLYLTASNRVDFTNY